MALLTFQKSTFISLKETIREVCLDFHCYSSLFGQGTQYFFFSPICLMAKVVKKKKKDWTVPWNILKFACVYLWLRNLLIGNYISYIDFMQM